MQALLPSLLPSLVIRYGEPAGSLLGRYYAWVRYTDPVGSTFDAVRAAAVPLCFLRMLRSALMGPCALHDIYLSVCSS